MDTKRCKDCGEIKPVSEFTRQSKAKDGLYTYCKPCARARVKASVQKRKRGELPIVAVEFKVCGRCGVERPASEFNVNRARRDGLTSRCIPCEATNRLRLKYGMSQEDFDARLVAQGGCCAVCGDALEQPVVDHCHAGGQVRALLCHGCNAGLGLFRDDPERLVAAAAYLRAHGA